MRLDPDAARALQVRTDMQAWLDRAVIGLNLCPFAKGVVARGLLHWAVSDAVTAQELLDDLAAEAGELLAMGAERRDTAILVAPDAMPDFLEFHAFQRRVAKLLRARGLSGVLQVAPFHPAFEFAQEPPEATGHYSNRAPYPALHLLREDSVARAVASSADAASIVERNLATLNALGHAGWRALGIGPGQALASAVSESAPRGPGQAGA